MQIPQNHQSPVRIHFGITFSLSLDATSRRASQTGDQSTCFTKIVGWSPFSLAQRDVASREREKVIMFWGQTGCWNLRIFKIVTFFMFMTAYLRENVNHITFWGNHDLLPPKKSCQVNTESVGWSELFLTSMSG